MQPILTLRHPEFRHMDPVVFMFVNLNLNITMTILAIHVYNCISITRARLHITHTWQSLRVTMGYIKKYWWRRMFLFYHYIHVLWKESFTHTYTVMLNNFTDIIKTCNLTLTSTHLRKDHGIWRYKSRSWLETGTKMWGTKLVNGIPTLPLLIIGFPNFYIYNVYIYI